MKEGGVGVGGWIRGIEREVVGVGERGRWKVPAWDWILERSRTRNIGIMNLMKSVLPIEILIENVNWLFAIELTVAYTLE